MKVTVHSSMPVKPDYSRRRGGDGGPSVVRLTVFDRNTYDMYISGINFFRPPAPDNATLAAGLARALAEYREWAGRLGVDEAGHRAILLNDAGARFVEATADVALGGVVPIEPSPEVLSLHPDGDGTEELVLVQVTRFACGSVAVGHTMHHMVGDGRAACNFLLAWGQATRGAAFVPPPVHDRASFFAPRRPPRVQFEHRSVEFKRRGEKDGRGNGGDVRDDDELVVHRVHFSPEFLAELKLLASPAGAARPCSTLQCVAAHLWRCITKARGLDASVVTTLRVAVDGRARMSAPRVPEGYTGNVVLWARPAAAAQDLVARPLHHAVELIGREVSRIDGAYFRSFVDFATSGAVEEERLAPTADATKTVLNPIVDVDSLLHVPFYEMDFGGGPPFFFMPSYVELEGSVFVARSFAGDEGVDAYVPLFGRAMDVFKKCCYSLSVADARL